jgi:dihydrofolate reductase
MVFNMVSLDGYFVDDSGDMSWAHKDDPEWREFTTGNAAGGEGVLVFGRRTYEMMAQYWPTPMAMDNAPVVAEAMNSMPKIVFSKTLAKATWRNTTLLKGEPAAEIRRLKGLPGKDMVIFGSGTIVAQLADPGLIDEYQIIVNPIILGRGRTMFQGVQKKVALRLTKTRTFGNGNVLLCYAAAG